MAIHAECGWCRDAIPLLPDQWRHRQYNGQINMCLASAHLHQRFVALTDSVPGRVPKQVPRPSPQR